MPDYARDPNDLTVRDPHNDWGHQAVERIEQEVICAAAPVRYVTGVAAATIYPLPFEPPTPFLDYGWIELGREYRFGPADQAPDASESIWFDSGDQPPEGWDRIFTVPTTMTVTVGLPEDDVLELIYGPVIPLCERRIPAKGTE